MLNVYSSVYICQNIYVYVLLWVLLNEVLFLWKFLKFIIDCMCEFVYLCTFIMYVHVCMHVVAYVYTYFYGIGLSDVLILWILVFLELFLCIIIFINICIYIFNMLVIEIVFLFLLYFSIPIDFNASFLSTNFLNPG